MSHGGRLLLTGGVSTIEGAGGGGLVPWALIGGYGTRNELGASAFVTGVDTEDFTLASYGGAFNFRNRLELSIARQKFKLREVGNVLALGNRYTISQTIIGAKVRLFGDSVLEQDSLIPRAQPFPQRTRTARCHGPVGHNGSRHGSSRRAGGVRPRHHAALADCPRHHR